MQGLDEMSKSQEQASSFPLSSTATVNSNDINKFLHALAVLPFISSLSHHSPAAKAHLHTVGAGYLAGAGPKRLDACMNTYIPVHDAICLGTGTCTSVFVYLSPNFYCNNFDHTFSSTKDF
jgi:hypothetical protein